MKEICLKRLASVSMEHIARIPLNVLKPIGPVIMKVFRTVLTVIFDLYYNLAVLSRNV